MAYRWRAARIPGWLGRPSRPHSRHYRFEEAIRFRAAARIAPSVVKIADHRQSSPQLHAQRPRRARQSEVRLQKAMASAKAKRKAPVPVGRVEPRTRGI